MKRANLVERRKAVGYSQEGLAEALDVSRSTIVRWERGETEPQPWQRPRLAKALRVSLGELAQMLGDRQVAVGAAAESQPADTAGRAMGPATEAPPDRSEVPEAFGTDLEAVVGGIKRLWTEDLQGSARPGQDTNSAPGLLSPVARWLVAPSGVAELEHAGAVRVGAADVDAVQATVRMFEKLDHDFGGGHARTASVQYLHSSVMPLLEGSYTDTVGRRLYAIATEATYKTGAMAYDVGSQHLARRYFVQALRLAQAADDRALGGKVLGLMSHQANFLGEYADAVDLARAAQLGGHQQATPRVRAMYSAMEARALASLGDSRGCTVALQSMERAFAQAGSQHAEDPDWIAYFALAEFHNELAHCFAALGQPREAARSAAMALAESGDQYPRSQTFCRLAVATAYLDARQPGQRDVEHACALAHAGLPNAGRLKSRRVRAYLETFVRSLEPYRDTAAATGFHERLAEVLGTQ